MKIVKLGITDDKKTVKDMKFSDQAIGSLMMALQRCLMEQSDITDIMKGFKLKTNEQGQLFILNPPIVKLSDNEETSPDA
jgi:hypothetical protein